MRTRHPAVNHYFVSRVSVINNTRFRLVLIGSIFTELSCIFCNTLCSSVNCLINFDSALLPLPPPPPHRWKATAWLAGQTLTWKNSASSCTTTWRRWRAVSSQRQCCSTGAEWAPTRGETVAGWVPGRGASLGVRGARGSGCERRQQNTFRVNKSTHERQSPPLPPGDTRAAERQRARSGSALFFSEKQRVSHPRSIHTARMVRTCGWVIVGDDKRLRYETPAAALKGRQRLSD